jgi:hypothetical protein
MSDLALLLVLGLPPAAIEFLALVWAKGRLRIGLAAAVFAVPLGLFGWLIVTANGPGDPFARLGLVALAVILLGGAVTGTILGGVVAGLRHLRRQRAA